MPGNLSLCLEPRREEVRGAIALRWPEEERRPMGCLCWYGGERHSGIVPLRDDRGEDALGLSCWVQP